MTVVVGLTGNMAAGKSAVAELWRRAGTPVISADDLAREAVAPGTATLAAIVALLGPEAVKANRRMDRAAVRRIVFADEGLRKKLEAIVHPAVRRLRDEWTARQRAAGADVVAWEIPLLFETGANAHVDVIVVVHAATEARRRRAMRTRGLSADEADAMMAAQLPARRKRERADYVIDNDGTRSELAVRAAEVLAQIGTRSRTGSL